MDSTFILTYLQDHFRTLTYETIEPLIKSHTESINEIIKGRAYSFYATPLKEGAINKLECDVLMGYFAGSSCSFKMRCGPIHETFSLHAGSYKPAYYDGPLPNIAILDNCVISDLAGDVYVVYATLSREQRKIVAKGSYNFHDAFHLVHEGHIYNHTQFSEKIKMSKTRGSWCSKLCRYKYD